MSLLWFDINIGIKIIHVEKVVGIKWRLSHFFWLGVLTWTSVCLSVIAYRLWTNEIWILLSGFSFPWGQGITKALGRKIEIMHIGLHLWHRLAQRSSSSASIILCPLGKPLFEKCWCYMGIAQNVFRPPPLSNRQTWKKSAPNHPGKPLHPLPQRCNGHLNRRLFKKGLP